MARKTTFSWGDAIQKLLRVGMKVAADYAPLVNVCLCRAGVFFEFASLNILTAAENIKTRKISENYLVLMLKNP